MSQYIHLTVKEVIRETEDAVTLVFQNPASPLKYKPGQFLTLIINIKGEKVRRSYSLCTYPGVDSDPAVTVKKVPGGLVSTFVADNVKPGDQIEVMEPMGIFTAEPDYHKKRDIVLAGGGSGITPLMGIARAILHDEPLSTVYLFYANRDENSIIFSNKLNQLKAEHGDRFHVIHVLSQPLNNTHKPAGRLNRSSFIKLLETFPKLDLAKAEYFVCGPKGLMEEIEHGLALLKVPSTQIHKESFVSGPAEEAKGKVVEATQDGPKEVTIIYQGNEYKIVVPQNKTILQTALDKKIDLPYSCQSGMCTACMGKCTSGKVHLDDPDGLSDKEIDQGYVLICVGHPVSSDVVIEID
jgi:ring-1,2-phenylacetyl-CoA epoxidase subunit PaaE